jgi:hypothetical protein
MGLKGVVALVTGGNGRLGSASAARSGGTRTVSREVLG